MCARPCEVQVIFIVILVNDTLTPIYNIVLNEFMVEYSHIINVLNFVLLVVLYMREYSCIDAVCQNGM